jgi:lysophospholipase L1-like esterase
MPKNPEKSEDSLGTRMLEALVPGVRCMTDSSGSDSIEPRILCYGDSLTAGLTGNYAKTYAPYSKRLSQLLNCNTDHIGLCGKTTSDMVRILDKQQEVDCLQNLWKDAGLRFALKKAQKEDKPYTAVVIMAGTNDIELSSAQKIVDNLMILHKACRSAGAVSVACAVPKHGAVLCNEFKGKLPDSQRSRLGTKVDQINALLRKRVQAANEAAIAETGNPAAGWIAFVDPHSEVIKKAGSKRASTYAGFPTLAQYSKAVRQPIGKENGNLPIHETATGRMLKRQQPGFFAQLEDALHFSEKGSHDFAEELVDLCKSHLVRVA